MGWFGSYVSLKQAQVTTLKSAVTGLEASRLRIFTIKLSKATVKITVLSISSSLLSRFYRCEFCLRRWATPFWMLSSIVSHHFLRDRIGNIEDSVALRQLVLPSTSIRFSFEWKYSTGQPFHRGRAQKFVASQCILRMTPHQFFPIAVDAVIFCND